MKEMCIPCSTAQEKQELIKHLVSLGYIDEDTDDHYLNLRTHKDDCIQSVVDNHCGKLEIVTPQQLLNKQEATINKLKEAVQNSGLSKSELSRRLGKHYNYLNVILRDGCSTKKQNELIEMINQVKAGERFKSDDEIIAELSEKLEKSQQLAQHNADCAHNYLAKLKDQEFIANQKSEQVKNLSTRNTDLEKALTDERKNAQNQSQRILELEAIIAPQNKEIVDLRATNEKYEHELIKAGEELLQQDEAITYQSNKIIKLNDECLLLNKENSDLNKQRKSYMAAFFMLLSLVIVYALWSAFK